MRRKDWVLGLWKRKEKINERGWKKKKDNRLINYTTPCNPTSPSFSLWVTSSSLGRCLQVALRWTPRISLLYGGAGQFRRAVSMPASSLFRLNQQITVMKCPAGTLPTPRNPPLHAAQGEKNVLMSNASKVMHGREGLSRCTCKVMVLRIHGLSEGFRDWER